MRPFGLPYSRRNWLSSSVQLTQMASAQAMIRYRLNDILAPSREKCACGSPLLALERVEGRCD